MRTFEVISPGMNRGDRIKTRYTDEAQGGANHSLPLHIDKLPSGTQSVAFALIDRDASDFVHWLVVDVPPGDIRIDEDASRHSLPGGARELYNTAGFQGYQGPDPRPRTGTHRYELVAYALDEPALEVGDHPAYTEFTQTAEQHAVGKSENYWVYQNG